MKSKISFFNPTIFWKNVTLYWPLWGTYTLFLFGGLPISLWFALAGYKINMTESRMLGILSGRIHPTYYICVIAFAALFMGMALFSYLYKSQSANMIHALPVDRTQLFGTNIISGLAFLIVPQIVTFILSVFVCLGGGIVRIEYLAMWLLLVMVVSFIAFSFVVICAFFTGQLIALPVAVVTVNLLIYAVLGIAQVMIEIFAYGVDAGTIFASSIAEWCSPFICLVSNVDMGMMETDINGNYIGSLRYTGIGFLVIYFIVAVVLYGVSYFLYKKRHIEHAGDLITVPVLKPIFRFCVGFIAGFYLMFLFYSLFGEIDVLFNIPGMLIVLLIFGGLCYFFAEMFVCKTFKVFKKKNWKGCGIFGVLSCLLFFGLLIYTEAEKNYIPEAEEVVYAEIRFTSSFEVEGESLNTVIAVHKEIVDHVGYYEDMYLHRYHDYTGEVSQWQYFRLEYYLKDGRHVSRRYHLPVTDETKEIIGLITQLEQEPEVIMAGLFGANYEKARNFFNGEIYFEIFEEDIYREDGYYNYGYVSAELTSSQTESIFKAAIEDAKAGTLLKYNGYGTIDPDKYGVTTNVYGFSFKYSDENLTRAIHLSYGADCENIIRAILDLGLEGVETKEDIVWNYDEMKLNHLQAFHYLYGTLFGRKLEYYEAFKTGWTGIGLKETQVNGETQTNCLKEFYLSPEDSAKIFEAVLADVKEGTMLKYQTAVLWEGGYDFLLEDLDKSKAIYTLFLYPEEEADLGPFELSFGYDCKNVLLALEQVGIIDKQENVIWDMETELTHAPIIWNP